MQRKRDGLVPIGEAFGDLGGPVKAIRDASPQARRKVLALQPPSDPHWRPARHIRASVSAESRYTSLGMRLRRPPPSVLVNYPC